MAKRKQAKHAFGKITGYVNAHSENRTLLTFRQQICFTKFLIDYQSLHTSYLPNMPIKTILVLNISPTLTQTFYPEIFMRLTQVVTETLRRFEKRPNAF